MLTPPFGVPQGTPPHKVRETLRSEIEQRLRHACSGWSDDDFQKLVDDATAIAMKYVPNRSPGGASENR